MHPHEVIDRGYKSKTLRENPVFSEAVKDVYWKLTLAEDTIVADLNKDGREMAADMKRIAQMRALLADLILILDGNIQEGENEQYKGELNNE